VTQVYFSREARKIFDKLKDKKLKVRITQAIKKLSPDHKVGTKLQGKLERTYSIRVWPYRILYEFTKEKGIIITDIGHRKVIYR